MTNESARIFEEAKEDERTVQETLGDLHKRNSRLDWDIISMSPEIIDRG